MCNNIIITNTLKYKNYVFWVVAKLCIGIELWNM